jgi:hypothetical protein
MQQDDQVTYNEAFHKEKEGQNYKHVIPIPYYACWIHGSIGLLPPDQNFILHNLGTGTSHRNGWGTFQEERLEDAIKKISGDDPIDTNGDLLRGLGFGAQCQSPEYQVRSVLVARRHRPCHGHWLRPQPSHYLDGVLLVVPFAELDA